MTDYDPDQMAHSEAIFMLRKGLKHGEVPEKYEPAIERCREAFGETLMEALNDIPPEKRAGKYRPTHSDADPSGEEGLRWQDVEHIDADPDEREGRGGGVTELWLCEAHHVVLRPDRLYRFGVHPDCDKCDELADSYDTPDPSEGEESDYSTEGDANVDTEGVTETPEVQSQERTGDGRDLHRRSVSRGLGDAGDRFVDAVDDADVGEDAEDDGRGEGGKCECGHWQYQHLTNGIGTEGYVHGKCDLCDCTEYRPAHSDADPSGEDTTPPDVDDPSREWNTREYLDEFYGERPYLDPWRYATIHVTASEAACLRAASERYLREFEERDGRVYDWKQGVRHLFEREIGYDYDGPGVNRGEDG